MVAEGHHRGAGTPHAEVGALPPGRAGRARGADRGGHARAVQRHRPHWSVRRGPVEAGVARVVHAQSDADPAVAGGVVPLRAAGVEVEGGLLADEARGAEPVWTLRSTRADPS